MPTLDDLPPHRGKKLLWRFAHLGVHGVEKRVREEAGRPCLRRRAPVVPPTAVLGDDGRAHLVRDGQVLCAQSKTETEHGWDHQLSYDWWEGEGGPKERTGIAAPDGFHYASDQVAWSVRLTGCRVELLDVPPEQRCFGGPYETMHHWGPRPARTAIVRRLRTPLVEALGPYCHLCGTYPGSMVDHDHVTGLVRGLLCALCNRALEECPHVDGCPKAEYMDRPPAAHLGLVYPASAQWKPKASTRAQKLEELGFDPFEVWPPPLWCR